MRFEHWFYMLPLRLRSLFRRRQVEQDLDEELQYHLERKVEELVAQGQPPEQARRNAVRAMDGLAQQMEECRDARGVNFIEHAVQDVRYSLRVLRKSPGFTTTAVLTLALAIGANAVVFGVMNGLILRPLDVPRAESLYGIEHGREHSMYESYPDYLDLRERNRSFEDLAAFDFVEVGLDSGDNPTRAWGDLVSGNYFDVLGVQPYLGHFFHGSDEHGPNSAPFVVLSYGYWHTHFRDDRGVVGRTIELNKHPFVIVGVAPPEFHGTLVFESSQFFVPMVNQEQVTGKNDLHARRVESVFMTLGHLKAGVTAAQAVADLNAIGSWLERTYPNDHGTTSFTLARPRLYGNYLGGPVRAFFTGLMLLAGLILLGACANLGSLFAARAADRAREVALRLALGASRNRILRTLFTEAALISLAGGAVGLFGSVLLLRALSVWQPIPKFPVRVPVSPDANVYLVALLLALVSGVLFGLVPVRQVLRVDPYQVVKAGPTGLGRRRLTARDLLLAAQIAICAVLVTSSMVAVRGLLRSMRGDFGFEPRHAMLVSTDLAMAGYRGDGAGVLQKRMVEAVAAIPGVDAVGMIDWPPLYNGGGQTTPIFRDEASDLRPSRAAAHPMKYSISDGYLGASGTTLLAGRTFSAHDDQNAPRVALVNRRLAGQLFGSTSGALGKYYKLRDGTRIQVVGVVEDGKYISLTEDPEAAVFFPILQMPSTSTGMAVRSARDPQQLAAAIRSTLRGLDRGLPAYIETWEQALDLALFPARTATVALGVLGMMGAMLSLTGLFGMAAYSVSKRLKELGIRMALGAQRREVLAAALGRAFRLLAIGSAAGLFLGILASRVLAAIVYQATPRDPVVLAGVVLAMAALGLLATWIPAQRALTLDPSRLLREE